MKTKFKALRKEQNLSLEEVARRVGISKVYLWQIENDKRRLNYSLAIKLAEVFSMKPDQIFYNDELK